MKIFNTFLIPVLFLSSVALFGQYSGGTACGFSFNTSAAQQINDTIYNDLYIVDIITPVNNDTVAYNTPLDINISIQNMGTFPVLPDHSIYVNIFVDNFLLSQQSVFLTDTLNIGQDITVLLPNQIIFADTGLHELCIELNGTSFALDTIISNNRSCISLFIVDPTGIIEKTHPNMDMFYNNFSKNLHFITDISSYTIDIYDTSGKKHYSTTIANTNNFELDTKELSNGFYIVRVGADNFQFSMKFIKY